MSTSSRLTPAARAALLRLRDGSQTAHQPPLALRELREKELLDLGHLTPTGREIADRLAAQRSAH